MAKANQYHRGGHTYRKLSHNKIPLKKRRHNKDKWKKRQEIKHNIKTIKETPKGKGLWWKNKFRREKNEQ